MKLMLLVLPNTKQSFDSVNRQRLITIPFGVLSIASYVRKFSNVSVEIKVVDLNDMSNIIENDFENTISFLMKEYQPDIVGLSIMFNDGLHYIDEISRHVKKHNSHAIIFAGGITASNLYEKILGELNEINAVCIGEGEIPILQLINAEDKLQLLEVHASWITAKSMKTGKVPRSTVVEDLDEIPPINYNDVNIHMYGERAEDRGVDKNKKEIVLPMHTSRGCPFNCIFCCAGQNHGKRVRYMSAKRVVEDIKEMINKYGATKVSIDDDQFLLNKNRAIDILNGVIPLNIKLDFPSGVTVKCISEEIAYLMSKCGVKKISLAIESGSERMLEQIIDKPLRIKDIEPVVLRLRKYGIKVNAFFVQGIPGERDEDRKLTLELIDRVGFDWNYIFVAMPFPGSRLYELCIENNYISNKIDENTLIPDEGVIRTPEIDPEEISEEVYKMNLWSNFVNNYNMRQKQYLQAKNDFLHIADRYPNHAFAYYYLALTCEKLNYDNELIDFYKKKYIEIIKNDVKWKNYALEFSLPTECW